MTRERRCPLTAVPGMYAGHVHMRNMQGKHSKAGIDLESAYFRRYGTDYNGLRVPFGALVEVLPTLCEG